MKGDEAVWKEINLVLARRLPRMAGSREAAVEILLEIRSAIAAEKDWDLRRELTAGMRKFCDSMQDKFGHRHLADDGSWEPLRNMFPIERTKPKPEEEAPFEADGGVDA